jgi:hypothetical protein
LIPKIPKSKPSFFFDIIGWKSTIVRRYWALSAI